MNALFTYELKVAVVFAVFYICYKLLLSNEKMHRVNRFVIIGTMALAFVLPFCVLKIHKVVEMPAMTLEPVKMSVPIIAETGNVPVEVNNFNWQMLIVVVYFAGVVVALSKLAVGMARLMKLINSGSRRYVDDCEVVVVNKDVAPFSWVKWIVLSEADYVSGNRHILEHEKSHIALGHSYDVLFVNMLSALQWFNPTVWLMRRDLMAIHEYEADDCVLRRGVNIKEYQYSLIRKAVSASGYSIANSFNHSILKNRITMMSKSKPSMFRGLRVLYIVPIVGLSLAVNARTIVDYKCSENPLESAGDAVVINFDVIMAQSFSRNESGEEIVRKSYFTEVMVNDDLVMGIDNICSAVKELTENNPNVVVNVVPQMNLGLYEDIKTELCKIPGIQMSFNGDLYPELPTTRGLNIDYKDTDVHSLLINKVGQMMFDSRPCKMEDLCDLLKPIARNASAKRQVLIVSTDRGTTLDAFANAVSEVNRAIDVVRDEYSHRQYGKSFDNISSEEKSNVEGVVSIEMMRQIPIFVDK